MPWKNTELEMEAQAQTFHWPVKPVTVSLLISVSLFLHLQNGSNNDTCVVYIQSDANSSDVGHACAVF